MAYMVLISSFKRRREQPGDRKERKDEDEEKG
jgi:hypothetical protein